MSRGGKFFSIAAVLFLLAPVGARASSSAPTLVQQSVSLPRNKIEAPAVDLLLPDGTPVDRDRLVPRIQAGEDISLLEPSVSDIWNPAPPPREPAYPAPAADGAVHLAYDSIYESPLGLMRSRVTTDDEAETPYRLVMTWNLHSALMNAELLRRLGYTIDRPRHYARGVIRFPDLASRDAFITEISRGTTSEPDRWLVRPPAKDELQLEIRDFVLEPGRITTPPYYWGAIANTALQGRRVLRALLPPLALTHVPDSINLWSWEAGKIISDSVILYHPVAGSFAETTYQDARWVLHRLARLTEDDLRQVILAGGYPAVLEPLLLEKLKARRNHLLQLFGVKAPALPVREGISYRDPATGEKLVENGKLLRKHFDGYGFDFIGEDPENPLRRDEIFRFLKLDGIGIALNTVFSQLNERLLSIDTTKTMTRDGNWLTASGITAGLRIEAARKVVSGTYYGSDSPVQLVDRVSLGASLGYFLGGKYNAPTGVVSMSAKPNVGVQRSFLHVKPVASMEQALKTPWKELAVIPKMRALARLLDARRDPDVKKALREFFDTFTMGEGFTLVDALDLGLNLKASVPVASTAGTVGLSAGVDGLILRRTMIQRLADGRFQISLQNVKRADLDFGLSANLVLQIIAAQTAPSWTEAKARVFVIDPTALTLPDAPVDGAEAKKLIESLAPLLRKHDTTALERHYAPFPLEHRIHGTENTAKVLPWKFVKYHEEHRLHALPQEDRIPTGADPEDYARDLLALRDVTLRGVDFLGFLVDSFGSGIARLFPKQEIEIASNGSDGDDPANNFLGRSHSWETRTEAELTPERESRAIVQLQEEYAGWRLSKKRLFRIIAELEKKIRSVAPSAPLIRRSEFQSTEKLLLYRITALLLITEKGIEPLRLAAWQAPTPEAFADWLRRENRLDRGSHPGWLKSVYKKLRRIPAAQPARPARLRIEAVHSFARHLYGRLELGQIIRLLGESNVFFNIRVAGFRTKDENGDSEYLSDSIGIFDEEVGAGAFREFAAETGISEYEVYGQYAGGGL